MDGPMPLTRTKDNLEIWGIVLYSTRMNDECWMTKFLIREKKEKNCYKWTYVSRETQWRTMKDKSKLSFMEQ